MMKFWMHVQQYSNGDPVNYTPVKIGTNQSRFTEETNL